MVRLGKSFLLFSLLSSLSHAGYKLPGSSQGHGYIGRASSVAAAPPAFSPASLPGNIIWYDMQDATKYTLVSNKISALTDKSVAGNNATQSDATHRFTYNATGINGHPAMDYNSVASAVFMTNPISSLPGTYCAVMQQSSDGVFFGTTVNQNGYLPYVSSAVFQFSVPASGLATYTTLPHATGVTDNVAYILCMDIISGANAPVLYVNNVQVTTSGTGSFSAAGLGSYSVIGASYDGTVSVNQYSYFLTGFLGEVDGYTPSLSNADRNSLYTYLKAKWGTP